MFPNLKKLVNRAKQKAGDFGVADAVKFLDDNFSDAFSRRNILVGFLLSGMPQGPEILLLSKKMKVIETANKAGRNVAKKNAVLPENNAVNEDKLLSSIVFF